MIKKMSNWGLQCILQPLVTPLSARFFGQDAAAGVVAPDFSDALRPKVLQALIKFLCAKAEGLLMGSFVPKCDHAITDMAQKPWFDVQ